MQPVIIRSTLLSQFENLVHGVSTVLGGEDNSPFKFNLSQNVGDEVKNVKFNREAFFSWLKVNEKSIVSQNQVHGCKISYINKSAFLQENDALITDNENVFLTVNIADCIPILIFDPKKKIVAAVHSGWRGTELKILHHTLVKLKTDLMVNPEDLYVYFGHSICKNCFVVDCDVAVKFPKENVKIFKEKYLIDLPGINFTLLKNEGVRQERIQISSLCTYEMKNLLHSYRRDGIRSGRMLAIIGMRSTN
ncbi:MAG: peptidoglycan editing factor PgeF [Ignavibacteria bacterium]|nr:peptidoglycan editing factor PgeF [Ignavibacteria bacterium]